MNLIFILVFCDNFDVFVLKKIKKYILLYFKIKKIQKYITSYYQTCKNTKAINWIDFVGLQLDACNLQI
jgi:hypothetical protein